MCHDQIHKLTVSKTQLKIAGVPVSKSLTKKWMDGWMDVKNTLLATSS